MVACCVSDPANAELNIIDENILFKNETIIKDLVNIGNLSARSNNTENIINGINKI